MLYICVCVCELFYFDRVSREWDAIPLYIVNNKDWMRVWTEKCEKVNNGRLSWYGVYSLVKESQNSGYTNII